MLLLGLALSCVPLFAQSNPQTKPPGGTISGKVTLKGKPALGVTVGLMITENYQPKPTLKATTDEQGIYRIASVPAGSYQVNAAAPAFVSEPQTVFLAEGESAEGIDFALVRGGVITGKITDGDGRPVIEQTVNLVPGDQPPNQPVYYPSVQTDDRGIYRIFGVAAGRYKLYAGGRVLDYFFQTVPSYKASYKQVFYPDAADAKHATVIEVTEGSETSNIDISLGRATRTFAASGVVRDGQNNQPLSNVRFAIQMISAMGFVGSNPVSNSQGEFRMENLAPGKYSVFMLRQQESDPHADAVTFDIVDQDIDGLVVKTSKGASLAGTVVLENTDDKTVFARLLQLWVGGTVQGPGGSMAHSSAINPDGSFLLSGLDPGTVFLGLGSPPGVNAANFIDVRTELGGVIQPGGIAIQAGEQVTGARLVVHYGNATVYGVVNVVNGTLPAGAEMSVRVNRPGETASPDLPDSQVDARGHFLIEGLPSGTYDFTTSVYLPAGGVGPPPGRQQAVVTDGAIINVTITVDLGHRPGTSTLQRNE
jgi:hypothetical protein